MQDTLTARYQLSLSLANTAKILRHRFDEKVRETLLSIKWWNWPHEIAVSNAKAIVSNDLKQLCKIQNSLDQG